MRKKYILSILLTGILFIFSACDSWIDPDINQDPDSPEDPTLQVLLSSAEAATAYNTGGFDVVGVSGMWVQYLSGYDRQAKLQGLNYEFNEADVVNLWNGFYRDAMMNLKTIIDKSMAVEGEKSPYYRGIAKILMAYNLGTATQLWGNIPFSEAFQGAANLAPEYDTQEDIYDTLQILLDDAIDDLSDSSNFVPVSGDYLFGGSNDSWIKAANALKARYAIALAKINGNDAYTNALAAINAGALESSDDDLSFPFGNTDTEANPLFQFDDQRADADGSMTFLTLVEENHPAIDTVDTILDPRLYVYNPVWEPAIEHYYACGYYMGLKDSKTPFITYVEQLFIQAEAEQVLGTGDSKETLKSAVEASVIQSTDILSTKGLMTADDFNLIIAERETWLAAFNDTIDALADSLLYNEIMLQKHIAMFLQSEAYVDWRRTGIPDLTPNTGTEIPRRYPYSNEERLYNSNIPAVVSIFARNWFDPE